MSYIGDIWNSFRSTIRGFDTPHQLALGMALGIAIGLVPKDSALPYLLGIIAILTPGNLLCLIMGCLIASLVSPLLDPLTHQIGMAALTYGPLESTYLQLEQLPLVPWTRFENTVVMGNLILGLLLLLPTYWSFRWFSRVIGPRLYKALILNRFAQSSSNSGNADPVLQES